MSLGEACVAMEQQKIDCNLFFFPLFFLFFFFFLTSKKQILFPFKIQGRKIFSFINVTTQLAIIKIYTKTQHQQTHTKCVGKVGGEKKYTTPAKPCKNNALKTRGEGGGGERIQGLIGNKEMGNQRQ